MEDNITLNTTLFVYGTLQRGQVNHHRYCRSALSITPATTWGRFYALPAGYPALALPTPFILFHGIADLLADTVTQARHITRQEEARLMSRPAGDWDEVHGQVIEFVEPLRALPHLDLLEGFHPGGPSLYQRVLFPIRINGTDGFPWLAWTYTMVECVGGRRLRGGVWR